MMTTAGKINPFFIHRSDDVDDPWTAGMSMIRRKEAMDGDKKRSGSTAAITRNLNKKNRKKRYYAKKKSNTSTVGFRCTDGTATAGAHLRDFMHATSMHGLKYAAEKEASWIER